MSYTANLGHLLDLFEKDLPTWKTSSTLKNNSIGYIKKNDELEVIIIFL